MATQTAISGPELWYHSSVHACESHYIILKQVNIYGMMGSNQNIYGWIYVGISAHLLTSAVFLFYYI